MQTYMYIPATYLFFSPCYILEIDKQVNEQADKYTNNDSWIHTEIIYTYMYIYIYICIHRHMQMIHCISSKVDHVEKFWSVTVGNEKLAAQLQDTSETLIHNHRTLGGRWTNFVMLGCFVQNVGLENPHTFSFFEF